MWVESPASTRLSPSSWSAPLVSTTFALLNFGSSGSLKYMLMTLGAAGSLAFAAGSERTSTECASAGVTRAVSKATASRHTPATVHAQERLRVRWFIVRPASGLCPSRRPRPAPAEPDVAAAHHDYGNHNDRDLHVGARVR